ncbi:hypothetical protein [Plantactinospora sp. B5E13]|uniref:hypothetical protein n=1 Tax=unclassified Plantactinospora TaxID=2631981 RepID=UPI00325F12B2
MSQPEENREKSPKTDAVLRPPTSGPESPRPRPPRAARTRAEEEPAPETTEATEEA